MPFSLLDFLSFGEKQTIDKDDIIFDDETKTIPAFERFKDNDRQEKYEKHKL